MGKVSRCSRDCISGPISGPSGCGGVGWLPVDDNVSLRSLADSGHGPLMAPADWGGAKEAEEAEEAEVKESRPLASIPLAIETLLAILGSAGATLLMTPGYPMSTGG
jgi:hypothetical protein